MGLVFWVGSLLVQLPQTGTGSLGRLIQGSSVLMLSLVLPLLMVALALIAQSSSLAWLSWLIVLMVGSLWGLALVLLRDSGFIALREAEPPLDLPVKTAKNSYRNWFIFGSVAGIITVLLLLVWGWQDFPPRSIIYYSPYLPLALGSSFFVVFMWALLAGAGMWLEARWLRARLGPAGPAVERDPT